MAVTLRGYRRTQASTIRDTSLFMTCSFTSGKSSGRASLKISRPTVVSTTGESPFPPASASGTAFPGSRTRIQSWIPTEPVSWAMSTSASPVNRGISSSFSGFSSAAVR